MATQSLYRRFRPRKFSELYGQEHIVRALRNAVINGREGQAYLFSGPRGTGKTTTARILAKVLNCENPVDGEPCCECPSCIAVQDGNSYDVLELDAASNNGVNEIRDIIETAALTSPGRHRVFILDEVHMLSKGAEAALLKTLEEPPAQVVFVLATTDPQKVSATIRSRVQHLQFHLLPMDELEKYVRYVVAGADLKVDDSEIAMVLRQGGGSARDTLSALELVAAGGGEPEDLQHVDHVVRAIIERDHGAALAAVAAAMQQGHDPHTFAEDVVRHMRDCFLAIMSPNLVLQSADRLEALGAVGRELGTQRVVRVMEVLGATMVEMRHAPDSRLLLEVAIVRLSSPSFDDSTENLLARIGQLEEAVKALKEKSNASHLPPAPVNPATGRAKIGGRASAGSGPVTAPPPASSQADTPAVPAAESSPNIGEADGDADSERFEAEPSATSRVAGAASPGSGADSVDASGDVAQMWPQVIASMKQGIAKAMFAPAVVESVNGNKVTLKLPANTPMKRAQEVVPTVAAAINGVCGTNVVVSLVQADPTSGIKRPEIPDEPETIDKIVEKDPYAAVDMSETVAVTEANDPLLDALANSWPDGSVVDGPAEK